MRENVGLLLLKRMLEEVELEVQFEGRRSLDSKGRNGCLGKISSPFWYCSLIELITRLLCIDIRHFELTRSDSDSRLPEKR